MRNNYKVLLCGATGLVGSECLRLLIEDEEIEQINILTRKEVEQKHKKIKEFIINFDDIEKFPQPYDADAIICALGTTINKAGSKEKFKLVDYEYPVRIAKMGLQNGVGHFLVVSSMGANKNSGIFYNRTKGEMENTLTSLAYEKITIIRPSLLLGNREEFRLGEVIAKRFTFLFPRKYKANQASSVAKALIKSLKNAKERVNIVTSLEINESFR